jgi:probable F420-dependent oxidoreductase
LEYGFKIPTSGPLANPEAIATLARSGEQMGFGIIGVSDHIVIPRSIRSRYPYSESGEFGGSGECMDQLTLLSFLAGKTSTARLLTSVMVVPHRSPVLTAKMLATIDVLSGGRLIVGCGVGWMKEEFEALGAPPFEKRGAVANEYIRAFKELWTSDDPTFDGEYVRFSDVSFEPRPVQKPHPPIWVGGESPQALRRAARLGDGWYPIGTNPRFPVGTARQLSASLTRLRRYTEEAGRDPAEIDVAYSAGWYDDPKARMVPGGDSRTFAGTPEQVAGDIRAFERMGVRHLMLGFQRDTVAETLERMERFVAEIVPLAQA